MKNEFRELTHMELQSIAGGFFNPLPEPDPVFVGFTPIPSVDKPIPDPPYWSVSDPALGPLVNPAFGPPTPEPAKPAKPGGP